MDVDIGLHISWGEFIKFLLNSSFNTISFCLPTFSHIYRFHSSESIHEVIAEVLLKSLMCDATEPQRQEHLKTLLTLDVPKLFALPLSGRPRTGMLLQKFENGWKKHIKDRHLEVASQECLSTFLVSVLYPHA